MNEKGTIKDLEDQAKNTKYLMDKLNLAAYGMTFQEALVLGTGAPEQPEKPEGGETV